MCLHGKLCVSLEEVATGALMMQAPAANAANSVIQLDSTAAHFMKCYLESPQVCLLLLPFIISRAQVCRAVGYHWSQIHGTTSSLQ